MPVPHPFDATATGYDAEFTATRLGRWLREMVWEHLAAVFRPGDHVLELGCGTGEDAVWLARCGVLVTATDASMAMLDVARRKAEAARVGDRIDFAQLDLAAGDMPPSFRPASFAGAFSNFGALNCLPDRRPVAAMLGRHLRPGGKLVVVLMGPLCPWEMAWHGLHLQPGQALRRFRAGVQAHLDAETTVPTWYPSPRRLATEFGPVFSVEAIAGIGSLLPPSYLGHLVDRHPGLFARLARMDRRLGRSWPWTWLNDHYLMVLTRRAQALEPSARPRRDDSRWNGDSHRRPQP